MDRVTSERYSPAAIPTVAATASPSTAAKMRKPAVCTTSAAATTPKHDVSPSKPPKTACFASLPIGPLNGGAPALVSPRGLRRVTQFLLALHSPCRCIRLCASSSRNGRVQPRRPHQRSSTRCPRRTTECQRLRSRGVSERDGTDGRRDVTFGPRYSIGDAPGANRSREPGTRPSIPRRRSRATGTRLAYGDIPPVSLWL
jgi:hypothetical protein